MKDKELRMYGFVPYQMSGIQAGIQFGHAVVRYGRTFFQTDDYKNWMNRWETFIVLNGGTTNDSDHSEHYGGINKIVDQLVAWDIDHAVFREPDLGRQITGIALILSEECFSSEYKSLIEFMGSDNEYYSEYNQVKTKYNQWPKPTKSKSDFIKEKYPWIYNNYVDYMGGEKNIKLREYVKNFRLF